MTKPRARSGRRDNQIAGMPCSPKPLQSIHVPSSGDDPIDKSPHHEFAPQWCGSHCVISEGKHSPTEAAQTLIYEHARDQTTLACFNADSIPCPKHGRLVLIEAIVEWIWYGAIVLFFVVGVCKLWSTVRIEIMSKKEGDD